MIFLDLKLYNWPKKSQTVLMKTIVVFEANQVCFSMFQESFEKVPILEAIISETADSVRLLHTLSAVSSFKTPDNETLAGNHFQAIRNGLGL